jgi:hypothetical protein
MFFAAITVQIVPPHSHKAGQRPIRSTQLAFDFSLVKATRLDCVIHCLMQYITVHSSPLLPPPPACAQAGQRRPGGGRVVFLHCLFLKTKSDVFECFGTFPYLNKAMPNIILRYIVSFKPAKYNKCSSQRIIWGWVREGCYWVLYHGEKEFSKVGGMEFHHLWKKSYFW